MRFNDEISNKTIYVDLDSLFDTRFAVLLKYLHKQQIENLFKDDYYNKRIIDEFPGLPTNIFRMLYEYRTVENLKNAHVTKVTGLILYDLSIIRTTIENTKPVRLLVNTYPYKLTKRDYTTLTKIIKEFIPSKFYFIEYINVSPVKLKPSNISNNLFSIYMYSGLSWLNFFISTGNLKNELLTEINMHIPALINEIVHLNTDEEYLELFKNLETSYRPVVNLIIEPIEVFNLIK